jgi:hypothetical protein
MQYIWVIHMRTAVGDLCPHMRTSYYEDSGWAQLAHLCKRVIYYNCGWWEEDAHDVQGTPSCSLDHSLHDQVSVGDDVMQAGRKHWHIIWELLFIVAWQNIFSTLWNLKHNVRNRSATQFQIDKKTAMMFKALRPALSTTLGTIKYQLEMMWCEQVGNIHI